MVNTYKHIMDARQKIVKALDHAEKEGLEIDLDNVVLEITTTHPVSDHMIEDFIRRHYLDKKRFKLIGSVLSPVRK